ncbi:glycoside hydrolase family 15 protein [Brevundimonas sp.]|uniref:glycoside hydrolase family 15 protein n=1 Tax=Brevundimonas sp. TaxID=1871086 RepID=UPI003F71447F
MTTRSPYPPVEDLGVVGDRRTAALVDRHGSIQWMCLPNFDSPPAFGALLDRDRGGSWRFGPADATLAGEQAYVPETALLTTRWRTGGGDLELTDFMGDPQTVRSSGDSHWRTLLRRMRCRKGRFAVAARFGPRDDFGPATPTRSVPGGWNWETSAGQAGVWASFGMQGGAPDLAAALEMQAGDEAWMVAGLGVNPAEWSPQRAHAAHDGTAAYWREHGRRLIYSGAYASAVKRAALTMHLLSYAPTGALVAAPTTSLPERLGGERNYDYRYAWVRDVSLSLAVLALLGDLDTAERYMDWLCGLDGGDEAPLQVLYRIDGGLNADQSERRSLEGYCGSLPVRIGNHAARQSQIDSLGYLADCADIYLREGGRWKAGYTDLLARLADHTAAHWREPSNGIWELSEARHYVVGKVMSWVVLDRAIKIAERRGEARDLDAWRAAMADIHREVMTLGWSEARQAFRQRYDSEALDSSSLLISLMGFLPARHPRVLANIEALTRHLMVGGLLHRFDPSELPKPSEEKLGDFEGAFLPCCFWLASAWAAAGEGGKAEALVDRILRRTPTALLAEEMDGRTDRFLGNTPLLFSHAELVRAALEISKVRPGGPLTLMAGAAVRDEGRMRPGHGGRL